MTASELLRKVEELLHEHWAQGCLARDAAGAPTSPVSERAARWSLPAAVAYVAYKDNVPMEVFETAIRAVQDVTSESSQDWNDKANRTLNDVLKAVEVAVLVADMRGRL